jgi:hypothetical protein
MKRLLALAAAIVAVAAPHAAVRPASDDPSANSAPLLYQSASQAPAAIVGRWRSAPFELELASDLHTSVYGPRAKSVRSVDVVIQPSGEGTFRVTNLVRNSRGMAVPGTRSSEEVTFTLGGRETAPGGRERYDTKVVKAERRYLDEPIGTFPLERASLAIYLPSEGGGPIEVRYDTPEGTGSFWETLRPVSTRAPGGSAPAKRQN